MGEIDRGDEGDVPLARRNGEREIPPDEPYSVTISRAVADAADCSPVELSECVYDVVDCEALERALSGGRVSGSVSIVYCEHLVTIYSDDSLTVHDVRISEL